MIFTQLQWPKSNIHAAAQVLLKLKNRENRYRAMKHIDFSADDQAAGVVATEYNIGATSSPVDQAEPSEYGERAVEMMKDPLIQEFFPAF
jgi:spermidine/putrescine-binding protein